jgi:SAM-dependent methyltransferase
MGVGTLEELRAFWVETGNRKRLTKALIPRIAPLRGRVLDVGGGRDAPHDVAWSTAAKRIRLDLVATHRPDVQGNAGALPFADDSFDGAVTFQVLEHVSEPDRALNEIARVLVPGGTLVGSVPFIWPVHGDPHDYFRFSADGLRYLLRRFAQTEIVPIGNAAGAAWILLSSTSRAARMLNPLMRNLGSRPNPRCPEGYVFTARK